MEPHDLQINAVNSDLLRQYGISIILAWTSLLWKKPLQQGAYRKQVYLQATVFLTRTKINYMGYIFCICCIQKLNQQSFCSCLVRETISLIFPQNMTNVQSILVQLDGDRSLCITSQISAKDKSCQMHAVYVYNFTSSFRKLVCIFSCIFYTQISRM